MVPFSAPAAPKPPAICCACCCSRGQWRASLDGDAGRGGAGLARMSAGRTAQANAVLGRLGDVDCRGVVPRVPDGGAELPLAFRPRIVDSTTVQAPGARSTDWRLHYALDLQTLHRDWHELTDCHGAELLERVPIKPGDVLLGDRGYARAVGIAAVVKAGGHVIVRLPWNHGRTIDRDGRAFQVLAPQPSRSRRPGSRVGGAPHSGAGPSAVPRRGPHHRGALARSARASAPPPARRAARQQRDGSAHARGGALRLLFTTLSRAELSARNVLELYRYRWQVELAFKRHKQILKLGQLPHRDPEAAQSWILSKLIVALLLEAVPQQRYFPLGIPRRAHHRRQPVESGLIDARTDGDGRALRSSPSVRRCARCRVSASCWRGRSATGPESPIRRAADRCSWPRLTECYADGS